MRTIIFAFVNSIDEISARAWTALVPHTAGKAGDVGRAGPGNRRFLNAVFRVARHGCAWRALPARFGKHDTLRKRSRRRAQKSIWQRLLGAVQGPALDWVMRDSTIGRARAQAAGRQKKAASGTKPAAAAAAG